MELITLYKDNNNEVKMFDFAIKQLEDFANSVNTLTTLEQEEILALILDEISKQTSLKEKKIITTSKVPILNRGRVFNLVEEYIDLEDAVLLLSEVFDKTTKKVSSEWKGALREYISSHYFLTF